MGKQQMMEGIDGPLSRAAEEYSRAMDGMGVAHDRLEKTTEVLIEAMDEAKMKTLRHDGRTIRLIKTPAKVKITSRKIEEEE